MVMILVGFAAWHSGTNLLYLIFASLFAFFIVHGNLLWVNLRQINVQRKMPRYAVAEANTLIEISLSNHKRFFDSFGIVVSWEDVGVSSKLFFPHIERSSPSTRFVNIVFPKRGFYKTEGIRIISRYPFLFEERSIFKKDAHEFLVFPPVYEITPNLLHSLPTGFGDNESARRGTGTELYGIRQYSPGEHARHIHWKSTARSQKVMIMEYYKDEKPQISLVLNNIVPTPAQESLKDEFEKAVIITASLASYYIDKEYEVNLVTGDKKISVFDTAEPLTEILKHLARIQLSDQGSLSLSEGDRANAISILYGSATAENELKTGYRINTGDWNTAGGKISRL